MIEWIILISSSPYENAAYDAYDSHLKNKHYPKSTMINRHMYPALCIDLLTQVIDSLILSFGLHHQF